MRRWKPVLFLAVAATLTLPAPGETRSNQCRVTQLTGVWGGNATARRTATSPQELMRCRVQLTWRAEKSALHFAFHCLGFDEKFSLNGELPIDQASGKVSGTLRGTRNRGVRRAGSSQVSGQCRARQLDLVLTHRKENGIGFGRSRLLISVGRRSRLMVAVTRADDDAAAARPLLFSGKFRLRRRRP